MSGSDRRTIRCTKRLLMGGILSVTLFAGTGILAAPASAQSTKSAQVARCTKATTGRSNLTKANVADCRSAVLVQLRCDSGPSIGVVKVQGVAYALRQGSRPVRMGDNYRVVQLVKVCASAAPAAATTTVPPTTTTTVTLPPTTTPPTAPPTTSPPPTSPPPTSPPPTAAPVSTCSPTTSSGNCYSAGEFCPSADHGLSGVAGNGEAITCRDNNGWRWEPS